MSVYCADRLVERGVVFGVRSKGTYRSASLVPNDVPLPNEGPADHFRQMEFIGTHRSAPPSVRISAVAIEGQDGHVSPVWTRKVLAVRLETLTNSS